MLSHSLIENPDKIWLIDVDNTLYKNQELEKILEDRYVFYLQQTLGCSEQLSREINKYLYERYNQSGIGAIKENLVSTEKFLEFVNFVHDINLPDSLVINDSIYQIVKRIRGRKFIFSNSITSHIIKILNKFEILEEFEKIYDIFAFGLRCKPDPEVFSIVTREHNLNMDQLVLIDDSEKNLNSAEQLGIDILNPLKLKYVFS